MISLKLLLLFVGGVSVGVGVGNIGDKKKPTYAEVILVNLGVILIIVTTLLWSDIPIK